MSLRVRNFRLMYLILFGLLAGGCTQQGGYQIKHVAKSDIDMVADMHLQEMERQLSTLLVKLYKRNPGQLRRVSGQTIATRKQQIFGKPGSLKFEELGFRERAEAIKLSFMESYRGDRVFALMAGLTGMIRTAYNNRSEFFLLDSLNHQKLYNSARNLEILLWQLKHRRDRRGELFILTNSRAGEEENLSFERLFGKMIATQDMMARITADRSNRTINLVVQQVASAVFLPVGI